tara:strand:- start:55 stop:321 length:267 start_codon:yes stop_codon:yes gene_type:complete
LENKNMAEPLQLTLQDIDAVVRVIDIVSTRGAIRGDELVPVGQLRAKFVSVLEAEAERQKALAPAPVAVEQLPLELNDVDGAEDAKIN